MNDENTPTTFTGHETSRSDEIFARQRGSDLPSSGSSVPTSVTIYETEPNYIEVKLPEGTTYTISDDNRFRLIRMKTHTV